MGYLRNDKSKFSECIVDVADFIQSLIFIASIINAVLAPLIGKIQNCKFPPLIMQYANLFSATSIEYFVNCLIMLFFIIKLVIGLIMKYKLRNEEMLYVIDRLHKGYIHNMRDHMRQLEETQKELSKIDVSKNIKEFEKCYNNEYKILEDVAQQCVDQISELINSYMGMESEGDDSVCTCIKMVSIHEVNKPITQRSVITLARSKNSSRKRMRNPVKSVIGENSDFLDLSKGYRNYFCEVNLRDKYKRHIYSNSTPDFKYESTIVVPIRFADMTSDINLIPLTKKKKEIEINIRNEVDIVGYLCIDTEKVLWDWKKTNEVDKILKILAFYADSLYIYLSAFRRTFAVKV